MILMDVNDCNEHYCYGTIKDGIVAKCFIWEEEEKINIQSVIDALDFFSKKRHLYLITTKEYRYPLGTKDKYLKLWKYMLKEYCLLPKKKAEIGLESNISYIYMGIAEIETQQLEIALKIMYKLFFNSYIILSEDELNMEDSLKTYQEACFQKQKNCFDFGKVINLLCPTYDLLYFIIGYDGVSLNYFYDLAEI